MTIAVRLDAQLQREVDRAARAAGLSRSELIRRSLQEYLARTAAGSRAWELGKDLFGKYGSGRRDLSEKCEEIVRRKIHAKHRRS